MPKEKNIDSYKIVFKCLEIFKKQIYDQKKKKGRHE